MSTVCGRLGWLGVKGRGAAGLPTRRGELYTLEASEGRLEGDVAVGPWPSQRQVGVAMVGSARRSQQRGRLARLYRRSFHPAAEKI